MKRVSLVTLCISLTACFGWNGKWDFPYPEYINEIDTTEEKAEAIVKYLDENGTLLSYHSDNLKIEVSKEGSSYLETEITYTNPENKTDWGIVFWGDKPPYGSPDIATAENGVNFQIINLDTLCLREMQEMIIDETYDRIRGKPHRLRPYFGLCFDKLMNF